MPFQIINNLKNTNHITEYESQLYLKRNNTFIMSIYLTWHSLYAWDYIFGVSAYFASKTYLGLLYIKLKYGVFTVYKNIVHPLIFYYEL
jgi:hypothetical protein